MATKKKLLEAAAGNAGGAGLNVEDVFSTYLYAGNSSTQTITNGIDLAGEGGLVWVKSRTDAYDSQIYDTERGATKYLASQNTGAEGTLSGLTAFNADGFSIGSHVGINTNNSDIASWTFRKAPKFFDVVTYTGDGTSQRGVNHNLGVEPSVIIIKRTDAAGDNWWVAARSSGDVFHYGLVLNSTSAAVGTYNYKANGYPISDTQFFTYVGSGTSGECNASGGTYVAYLFAHNDGDGDFGSTADQDIIKCGSYTGNGSNDGPEINLGFEPQWIMIKRTSNISGWYIWDTMRGIVSDGAGDAFLYANASDYEDTTGTFLKVTATGFKLQNAGLQTNGSSNTYIYIAIRRGPMAVPESATDVFDVDTWAGTGVVPNFNSGFPVDMMIHKNKSTTSAIYNSARLIQGKYLQTTSTAAEGANANYTFDYQDGYYGANTNADFISWMWKRAPSFFDAVAYTGDGTASRNINHNLGVAPEMMWVKRRDGIRVWGVYHSSLGTDKFLILNDTNAEISSTSNFPSPSPTASVFTIGNNTTVNASGSPYIAYLFASLDGISKVGSYTGDGTTDGSKVIDCGFSAGARFVVIKKTSEAGNWITYDTERGIVSGNDSHLYLDQTSAEDTSFDSITPNSSGFAVNHIASNKSGVSYIFYAIA